MLKKKMIILIIFLLMATIFATSCGENDKEKVKVVESTKEKATEKVEDIITTDSVTSMEESATKGENEKEEKSDDVKQKVSKPGNSDGKYTIPNEAKEDNVSNPDHVIGNGSASSCKAEDFIKAVEQGGKIVFDTGNEPVTLVLNRPAKIYNKNPDVVIDGGGFVTLSGGGKNRIIYMNTCDQELGWTTSHCQNQDHPRLTVQNITFVDGNSKSESENDGGGAIWVRGGRFKVVNCNFFNNVCASNGPDVGGGAIRVFSQYNNQPVYVINSTFGGKKGYGNIGSNGGAISSIGVSWTIINSVFTHNEAIGNGGNPAKSGTSGGGSGGAIYNDGNTMTLKILGSKIENNNVNVHGSGIFFVTNNHTGNIVIEDSVIKNNNGGSWYTVLPNISMHDDTKYSSKNSTIE